MNSNFILTSTLDFYPDNNENVIDSIFKQYESVIIETLITSFGLDFFIKDCHGGDVDTIYNVRQIGKDKEMTYKNKDNQSNYNNRGAYKSEEYHKGTNYQKTKSDAKEKYNSSGKTVEDAYTGEPLYFLGRSKGANPKINAELDHVIAAKSIHDDPGRTLSNLSGKELANSPENLQFTNKSLNASMQDKDIPEYIAKHPELSDENKDKMMKHYEKSKSSYDKKIAKAYYTSSQFAKDTALFAGTSALKIGLKQALGLVCTEIWFAVKDEFSKIKDKFNLGDLFFSIGNAIKIGIENSKKKHKEIISKFKEGVLSGALSSISTTLSNIFFTTAKNVVKIIRQSYISLVQAGEILFINPEGLLFGDRMRAVSKVISLGASVVVGGIVNEAISKTPIGLTPIIGDILQNFCGTLVTGIMSCSLLYFFDRSEIMKNLVNSLNEFHTIETEVNYYREQAKYFEAYAAKLMDINISKFREDTYIYNSLSSELDKANNEKEINYILKNILNISGVKIPWEGEFDDFMKNKNTCLVFE